MTVTYTVSGSPQPAAPTFDPASGTASTTDITVTMSTTTSGATIRYTIDGAAPTASTGTVGTTATITGVGEHTLRAVAVKNGVASTVASATYTITNPSSGGENRYVLVTDASTLQAGDKLIIASSAAAGSAYAIANTQKSGNRPATAVTIGSDNGTLSIDPTSATEIFELGGSAGAWTFKAVSEETSYNNQYLIASGNEKNNYLKYTSAATSNEAQANIAISNNQATVVFNGSNTNRYMRYNPNNGTPIFNCYSSSSTTGNLVSLYRLEDSTPPQPSLTVVTGTAGFKQAEPGSTVRLYLPDSYNARVLHVLDGANGTTDAYIRDKDGAMLMQGISPNRPMHVNQHLAGWVNGQYSTNADGLPLFVPDNELTNTDYLVIADPVTETVVQPKAVAADELDDNLADWVTVSNLRIGDSATPTLTDAFGQSGYTAPYTGALVDVSAIAASAATLHPVSENGVPHIVHVVDSKQQFVSPQADLEGVTVRVARSLQAGQWAPLTLPFDYYDFDGDVQEYVGLANGGPVMGSVSGQTFAAGMMYFAHADDYVLRAGVPYLVKPNRAYDTFVASDVTLSAASAATVAMTTQGAANAPARVPSVGGDDVYSFIGTYSPVTLDASRTIRYFDESGNIQWADGGDVEIDGTTAYFTAPANQGLHVQLQDNNNIITGVDDMLIIDVPHTGTYNIMGVKMPDDWEQLPPGFYIVNGVKTIKH